MIITPAGLAGVSLITPQRMEDSRGYFARTFCAETFAAHGLPGNFVQCNVSFNSRRGTLRGLHWQDEPFGEGKLVRCIRGAVFDVAVDLRAGSPTRLRWVAAELSQENGCALYIPPGFAHGFQTLTGEAELLYQMTVAYHAGSARGARWDDPAIGIVWPLPDPILSPRDTAFPLLEA